MSNVRPAGSRALYDSITCLSQLTLALQVLHDACSIFMTSLEVPIRASKKQQEAAPLYDLPRAGQPNKLHHLYGSTPVQVDVAKRL